MVIKKFSSQIDYISSNPVHIVDKPPLEVNNKQKTSRECGGKDLEPRVLVAWMQSIREEVTVSAIVEQAVRDYTTYYLDSIETKLLTGRRIPTTGY
ncbi:hypothetical protein [Paenibacillus tuaregi]|uniref:hypothetical protein n=1 Tax=Paenibacillus tuaregi TaxID=1816681 RepID=UPI0011DD26AB|nr:hypothetical protein [Paenibacillus tuaregi]